MDFKPVYYDCPEHGKYAFTGEGFVYYSGIVAANHCERCTIVDKTSDHQFDGPPPRQPSNYSLNSVLSGVYDSTIPDSGHSADHQAVHVSTIPMHLDFSRSMMTNLPLKARSYPALPLATPRLTNTNHLDETSETSCEPSAS
jgi:hypothetical protein